MEITAECLDLVDIDIDALTIDLEGDIVLSDEPTLLIANGIEIDEHIEFEANLPTEYEAWERAITELDEEARRLWGLVLTYSDGFVAVES